MNYKVKLISGKEITIKEVDFNNLIGHINDNTLEPLFNDKDLVIGYYRISQIEYILKEEIFN